MATSPTLQPTRREQTTIQFGPRATATTTDQSASLRTAPRADDEWAEDGDRASGKYGLPLEDMFAGPDLAEKRGMEMLEAHDV